MLSSFPVIMHMRVIMTAVVRSLRHGLILMLDNVLVQNARKSL